MKSRLLLVVSWLLGSAAVVAAPLEPRFSLSLTAAERSACGINRLTSDLVASIDALVRREAGMKSSSVGAPAASKAFSATLTPEQRRAAGLERLSPAEQTQLDFLAVRWLAPRPFAGSVGTAVSAGPSAAGPEAIETEVDGLKPQIHGAITLEYGAGSGGYSEKTGAIELNYWDPVHNFGVDVGYAVTQVKSKYPVLGCGDYLGPAVWAPVPPLR